MSIFTIIKKQKYLYFLFISTYSRVLRKLITCEFPNEAESLKKKKCWETKDVFTKKKRAGKPNIQAITIPAKSPPDIPVLTKLFLWFGGITIKRKYN